MADKEISDKPHNGQTKMYIIIASKNFVQYNLIQLNATQIHPASEIIKKPLKSKVTSTHFIIQIKR